MRLYFILILFLSGLAFSQEPSSPCDINDDDDLIGYEYMLELSRLLASEVNYYAYLPTGKTEFIVENLSLQESTILLISVDAFGHQQRQMIYLNPGQTQDLASFTRVFKEYYLFSLLNFKVTGYQLEDDGARPVGSVEIFPPKQPLDTINVLLPSTGNIITVGVDGSGICHYPVYGQVIGILDPDNGAIVQENGTALPIANR